MGKIDLLPHMYSHSLFNISSHLALSSYHSYHSLVFYSTNVVIFFFFDVATGDEIEKFNDLIQALQGVGNWEGLCRNLNVDEGILELVKNSYNLPYERKAECLKAYFNTGKAKWSEVIDAIGTYPINNNRLAKKIAIDRGLLRSNDEL